MVGIFVAETIAAWAIENGLDRFFKKRETFTKELARTIDLTIQDFAAKHPKKKSGKQFPFYYSQVIIDELLKFRFFSRNGYKLDTTSIENELNKNPLIKQPTKNEISSFLKLFSEKVKANQYLKDLEIDESYKKEIYNISQKIDNVYSFLTNNFKEIINLLEGEYKQEIDHCEKNLRIFKPDTALDWLNRLEREINNKKEHLSDSLSANFYFIKGLCFEMKGLQDDAFRCFINAHLKKTEILRYAERACISYFYTNEKEKAKNLAEKIILEDIFNDYANLILITEKIISGDLSNIAISELLVRSQRFQRLFYYWSLKAENTQIQSEIESLKIIVTPTFTELPELIIYENFNYWAFIFQMSFSLYLRTENLYYHRSKSSNSKLEYLNKILNKLKVAVEGSEVELLHSPIIFLYYWTNYEIGGDLESIHKLKSLYSSVKDKDGIFILLYANVLQKNNELKSAIKIINEAKDKIDENLISLKIHCQIRDNDEECKLSFHQYIDYIPLIRTTDILLIFNFLTSIHFDNKYFEETLIKIYSKETENQLIKDIVVTYLSTINLEIQTKTELLIKIDTIKNQVYKEEPNLRIWIARAYFNLQEFSSASQYLKLFIDKSKETPELFLYCLSLYHSKTDQVELLNILKFWRNNLSVNIELLRIEGELRQQLQDWKEIKNISEVVIKIDPVDESFYTLYILSLEAIGDFAAIKYELSKIETFNFQSTQNVLFIAGMFLRLKNYEESLKLAYKKATDKNDTIARQFYLSSILNYPVEFFKEYPEVNEDTVVKYQYNDEVFYIRVDQTTLKSNPLTNKLINKKVGDVIITEKPMTGKAEKITIIRIMNNYLGLYDEILNDLKNPLSGFPFELIEFPSPEVEPLEDFLKENFGAKGTEQKLNNEVELANYYNYSITFGELTARIFERDYMKSYYYLTSSQESKGFMITPMHIFKVTPNQINKYVLDLSACILIHEMFLDLNLTLHDKILIPNSLELDIRRRISFEELMPPSEFAVTITIDKIIPTFFPKDFQQKRLVFLSTFLKWLNENTSVVIPEKKLDLINPIQDKLVNDSFFTNIVDNLVLAGDPGVALVTDDAFYYKMLPPNSDKIISSEYFLINNFPSYRNQILNLLLKRKFIGLTINNDVLFDEFNLMITQKEDNCYHSALMNISLDLHGTNTLFIINETIEFIRKVALSSLISPERYHFEIMSVFISLIKNIANPKIFVYIFKRIQDRMGLLGAYYVSTIQAFEDALKSTKKM